MALERKLAILTVAAALFAATVGCGSSPPANSGAPAPSVREDGAKKDATTFKNGKPLNGGEKAALRSMKGRGEP
ncbi:MAG TPA: hypothetical protein VGL56_14465 [Fimbriimonadaceae bacterium]|jgi:hypothetical protein